MSGIVTKVSGPLVVAEGLADANVSDVVRVGSQRLIGEILNMSGDSASIQVYEETSGLGPGAEVETTGLPLSVELGPGMLENIYDGIQRPLPEIRAMSGECIARGVQVPALNRERVWHFDAAVEAGAHVAAGDVLGTVQETPAVLHKIMVPPGMSGTVKSVASGDFTVEQTVAVLEDYKGATHELSMIQRWPVRVPRPYGAKHTPNKPMNSGQRVIDTMFPIAKGGTAAVPGPFGSGKTVVQHQLAKWSDVDIVVYIGCGERGNEMTDVLMEFPELTDPRNGEPLMKRTVLIANTSDMPVAAREASIYTGITIAEYFRDMGYDVAVLADSTSRWAEALREMSGRLEEMPGEEGYPAYLASRLAQFYERAGVVDCLGSDNRRGSVTAIGAVSPPGGDTSEPVSQATMRIVKVFWGLDSSLAYARHFPAINWLTSYSLYVDNFRAWYNEQFGDRFMANRDRAMHVLQEEAELQEIVRLVGQDALSPADRLTMETAKMIREDFLQQNAFIDEDAYSSYYKQFRLLDMVLQYDDVCRAVLPGGADVNALFNIPARERIGRAKMVPQDEVEKTYGEIIDEMKKEVAEIAERGEDE
ncbi:MAG TPA: V-type ATP synthase subunit A [Candidatus Scatomorpha merdipullorum]|uniref:V-type ATP synthase alpha chain n=1 Tax=Candidatus Scatomorpha merdipullorum TaxID=2840927 RepID=A0A9D1FES7_9FIRM|nr:V-type ATP synthase subunit A [Candidatus Scatomorpha merdipullorum]